MPTWKQCPDCAFVTRHQVEYCHACEIERNELVRLKRRRGRESEYRERYAAFYREWFKLMRKRIKQQV